ncbi:MAG: hypothetical protein GX425_17765 [Peptococcaceae bacterium]|nr:hypothetical protein [Peptococcaceae bacterium]
MFKKLSLFAVLLAAAFLVSAVNACAGVSLETSAVQFLKNDYQKNGIKNTEYDGVGSYAFYVLTQKGIDVSAWTHNGKKYKSSKELHLGTAKYGG